MPELPEVETVARALREGGQGRLPLIGRKVKKAEVLWHKTVAAPSPEEFVERIVGQSVMSVGRRGKYICVEMSKDVMLIHLKMSGDVLVEKSKRPIGGHPRMILWFADGVQMAFNNPRKFGRIWLTPTAEDVVGHLGPEPFDDDLTANKFYDLLKKRTRQIKPLLLDQTFLAGVGNIYADEALNLSKIHPQQSANALTKKQAAKLLGAIRQVLQEGIKRNGASIDWAYQGGEFQNEFRVYGRTDEPCMACGTPISKIVVGQRGTHFCPKCQRLD